MRIRILEEASTESNVLVEQHKGMAKSLEEACSPAHARVGELEEINGQSDAQVKTLEMQVKAFQAQLKTSNAQVDQLKALRAQLQTSNAQVGELQAQLQGSNDRVGELEALIKTLQGSNARVGELQAQLQASNTRVGELQAQLQASNAHVDQLKAQVKTLQEANAQVDDLKAQVKTLELKAHVKTLEEARAKPLAICQCQEGSNSHGGAQEADQRVVELKAEVQHLKSVVVSSSPSDMQQIARSAVLSSDRSTLQLNLGGKVATAAANSHEMQQIATAVSEREGVSTTFVADMMRRVTENGKALCDLTEAKKICDDRIQELKGQVAILQEQVALYKGQVASLSENPSDSTFFQNCRAHMDAAQRLNDNFCEVGPPLPCTGIARWP